MSLLSTSLPEACAFIAIGVLVTVAGIKHYHTAIRSKEMLFYKVKLAFTFCGLYGGGLFVLTAMRQPFLTVLFGALLLGFSAKLLVKRPDSRYIRKDVKRAVIARDLGDEEKYDSEDYHFDHIVPYSKGGDNSVKNLRLVSKKRNLRRGNRNPRLRDFYE